MLVVILKRSGKLSDCYCPPSQLVLLPEVKTPPGFTDRLTVGLQDESTWNTSHVQQWRERSCFTLGFHVFPCLFVYEQNSGFGSVSLSWGPTVKWALKKEVIKVEQLTWMNPTNQSGLKWFRKAQPKLPQPDYFNTNTATAQSHGAALTFWTL